MILSKCSTKRGNKIFLLLTLIVGIGIFYPRINYQSQIAQGDHGRDFYSFQQTFEGAVPYRDYWTQNGPIMPYYYALIYQMFGSSIQSTLLGYNILILLVGLCVFMIAKQAISPLASFGCTLWYWAFRGEEFFYTYNHIGGVLFVLATLYFLFRYIDEHNNRHVILGFCTIFMIYMIRPSIATGTLIAFIISLICSDIIQKTRHTRSQYMFYTFSATVTILGALFIYWVLVLGTPRLSGAKDASFWLYAKWDLMFTSLLQLKNIMVYLMTGSWQGLVLSIFWIISLIGTIKVFRDKEICNPREKNRLSAVFCALVAFTICNLGEYFLSAIWFRSFWSMTLFFLLLFVMLETGLMTISPKIRKLLFSALILFSGWFLLQNSLLISQTKQSGNLFQVGSHKVYLNAPQRRWIQTVRQTVEYINENVSSEEDILALPYTPLYYYLTDHKSPTRELIFMNRQNQEDQSLKEIKAKNVQYVLLSNRALRPMEERLGIFGVSYGLKIKEYLDQNFYPVATFGPYEAPAGWTDNHAVRIFKRK